MLTPLYQGVWWFFPDVQFFQHSKAFVLSELVRKYMSIDVIRGSGASIGRRLWKPHNYGRERFSNSKTVFIARGWWRNDPDEGNVHVTPIRYLWCLSLWEPEM